MADNFDITLGSASSCNVRIPRAGIAPEHARLMRNGDRMFVQDISDSEGVTINGLRIRRKKWIEVTRFDDLKLGGKKFELSPRLFLGRERLSLDTTQIQFHAPNGRSLCNDAFLRAEPGSLSAIMGPSGCGKSVFLNLISGHLRPGQGRVLLGENQYDLHRDFQTIRQYIGFVPQADVMLSELTVRESLHYRLQLKFPDMAAATRARLIDHAAKQLGFKDAALDRFLDRRIGSGTEQGEYLSGGERKRANIAHELVTQPLVLFLDEPTTGLSSADADGIIQFLRQLADQQGITIITTIHQPSRQSFAAFDNLLLMAPGGATVYNGNAREAKDHLALAINDTPEDDNDAEYLIRLVQDRDASSKITLGSSTDDASRKPDYLSDPLPRQASCQPPLRGSWRGSLQPIHELLLLSMRNLKVQLRDLSNVVFALGQAPLIAILICLAFQGSDQDHADLDQLAKTLYHYHGSEVLNQATALLAAQEAAKDDSRIGTATARQLTAPIFFLCLTAFWFGMTGACKEIVSERSIIDRECRFGVGVLPTVMAKYVSQWFIALLQVTLLVGIVATALLNFSLEQSSALFLTCWITAAVGIAVGLFVSSITRSYRAALSIVPLILVPQVLFGGLIRSAAHDNPDSGLYGRLSRVTPVQQAFKASIFLCTPEGKDSPSGKLVIKLPQPDLEQAANDMEDEFLDRITETETSSTSKLFGAESRNAVYEALLMGSSTAVGCLLFAMFAVRQNVKRAS